MKRYVRTKTLIWRAKRDLSYLTLPFASANSALVSLLIRRTESEEPKVRTELIARLFEFKTEQRKNTVAASASLGIVPFSLGADFLYLSNFTPLFLVGRSFIKTFRVRKPIGYRESLRNLYANHVGISICIVISVNSHRPKARIFLAFISSQDHRGLRRIKTELKS